MVKIGDLVSVKLDKTEIHRWFTAGSSDDLSIVEFIGNDSKFQDIYKDKTEFFRKPIPGDQLLWYKVVYKKHLYDLTKNDDGTFGRGIVNDYCEELDMFQVTFPERSFPTEVVNVEYRLVRKSSEYPASDNTRKVYFLRRELKVFGED